MLTLLDSDIISALVRLNPVATQCAEAYTLLNGPLKISAVSYYETLSGLLYRDARQQLGRLQRIIALSEVLPLTPEAALLAAQIEAHLRQRGQSIGPTDTLIAGIALANNLQLATNNTRHFSRVEGLQLVNWTQ